jgi:hypothetical protein
MIAVVIVFIMLLGMATVTASAPGTTTNTIITRS